MKAVKAVTKLALSVWRFLGQSLRGLQVPTATGAKRVSPVLALALVALVGASAILAAPKGSTPPSSTGNTVAFSGGSSPVATSAATATATATATHAPKTHNTSSTSSGDPAPTATPIPTDTPTPPSATATPIPTATPSPTSTATPSPSWHTVGSYSGSAPQTLTTLSNVTGPIRIDWTCQPSQALPTWYLLGGISATTTSAGSGQSAQCAAGNTSGSFEFDGPANIPGNTWQVTINGGSSGCGAWTAIVEEYY